MSWRRVAIWASPKPSGWSVAKVTVFIWPLVKMIGRAMKSVKPSPASWRRRG